MPKKILLIDDIEAIRRDIRFYINPPVSAKEGVAKLIRKNKAALSGHHQIDEAAQGQAGVEMVQAALDQGSPYDIVIVDLMLPPGINGIETIRRIRCVDQDVAIILCTGTGDITPDLVTAANGREAIIVFKPELEGLNVLISQLSRYSCFSGKAVAA